MEKFYITTAIDYVNAAPHIGHAYEKIATDVIAKHFKQKAAKNFFLTGSDEHGIKIERTAAANNKTPIEFCDEISDKFKLAWDALGIDYDRYIRTTEKEHEKVVQHIFKTLLDKGDIYKASYTGLYCSGCESFLSPRDLTEEGLCPNHMAKPVEVQEENYFFKLSKYKDAIKKHIQDNPTFLLPEYRAQEVINQLENVEDISISRSKSSVTWGIPVPEDDTQVIYVWIDALSNYLTGVGYLNNDEMFNTYWPANVHMIGKDILKFHSIYWIAILMAMELPLPKTVFGHGWITVNEAKMSKSLGNVINPIDIIKEYNLENADAFRYFMMTTTSFGRDGNYSDEDFKAKVNADLANNLGNLLNRSSSMLLKYFEGEIKPEFRVAKEDSELAKLCDETKEKVETLFNTYQITEAAEAIFTLVDATNKYVNEKAPWSLAKTEEGLQECGKVIYSVLETLRYASVLLYPYIPNIATDIWNQLSCERDISEMKLSDLGWAGLKTGVIVSKETIKPVFLRLDSEIAGESKKK